MKTIAKTLNKARFAILAVLTIGILGFLLTTRPSHADGQANSSDYNNRINPDPDACGVSLTVPKFLCRNVDDDNETAEWDKDEIPSPKDDDLRAVTITGTAGKGGGTMTLSILEGGEKIGGKFWKDPQKNEEETELSWNVDPNSSRTETLYIEGKEWSDKKEDVVLKAVMVCAAASDGSSKGGYDEQIEKTTVYQVDLDIDSENDNGFEAAGYSDDEDKKEAYNTSKAHEFTGKVVPTFGGDMDEDGVPHFADGFDLLGSEPLNEEGDAGADDMISSSERKFIPVRVRLEKPFKVDEAEVKFSYEDSVPRLESDEPAGDIRKIDVGNEEFPRKGLELIEGGMRLWTKDAIKARDKADVSASEGDFIPGDSNEESWIKWKDLQGRCDTVNGDREIIIYLEYVDQHGWIVSPDDLLKKIQITAREGEDVECDDDVAVTLAPVELDIDSDNNNNQKLAERSKKEDAMEWVGPDEETSVIAPGKILTVNAGDQDQDGMPDYADSMSDKFREDGYGLEPLKDYALESAPLTPIILSIPDNEKLREKIRFRFKYDASDPKEMTDRIEGESGRRIYELPEEGELRIWKKNTNHSESGSDDQKKVLRSAEPVTDGGDFVPKDEEIKFSELHTEEEGQEQIDDGIVLYVESLKANEKIGAQRVELEIGYANDSGSIDWVQTETIMFSSINTELMRVAEDGTTEKARGGFEFSHPSPIIKLTKHEVSNMRPNPDVYVGGEVVDILIEGTVKSSLCDTYPGSEAGSKGVIDKIDVYTEAGLEPFVTFSVNSHQKGSDPTSLVKPFPYTGTFSYVVQAVPVVDGQNVISLRARDQVYGVDGSSDMVFEASTPDDPVDNGGGGGGSGGGGGGGSSNSTTLCASLAFPETISPDVVDVITASASKDGVASLPYQLTETEADSGVFVSSDASFWAYLGSKGYTYTPDDEVGEVIVAHIVYTPFGLDHGLGLLESSKDSSSFTGCVTIIDSDSEKPVFYTQPIVYHETDGGEFHPYVFEVLGPEKLLKKLKKVKYQQPVQTESGGVTMLSFDADIKRIKDEQDTEEIERMFFKNSEGDAVGIVSFRQGVDGDDSDTADEEYLEHSRKQARSIFPNKWDQFVHGFGVGFIKGGAAMVGGIVDVVKFGGRLIFEGYVATTATLAKGGIAIYEFFTGQKCEAQRRAIERVENEHTQLIKTIKEIAAYGGDLAMALLTGDFSKLEGMSAVLREMVMMAAEVFVELFKEWNADETSDYDRGYYLGRAVFEIASFFIPITKLGLIGKMSKAKFLDELGKGSKFFQSGKAAAALQRTEKLRTSFAKARMCFVAGTLVTAQAGATPIEQINVGDMVMSRDVITGQQGYKQVIRTFVTHPDELYHLVYRTEDGQTEDEIVGTAPHPFFVVSRDTFVPMEQIRQGDVLSLESHGKATVVSIKRTRAPPGERFTTYNFEVADYHTYFVGQSGVWVHNDGKKFCDKLKSLFERFLRQSSDDVWDAYSKVGPKFDKLIKYDPRLGKQGVARVQMYAEARRRYFDDLSGVNPPWRKGGQSTVVNSHDNTEMATELKKNMETVYGLKPKGYDLAAHHIVPHKWPGANWDRARKVMKDNDVHFNEAANGTFVTHNNAAHEKFPSLGTKHQKLHKDSEIGKTIADRLESVAPQGKTAIQDELQKIASEIAKGELP